jgi:hypothetical protein
MRPPGDGLYETMANGLDTEHFRVRLLEARRQLGSDENTAGNPDLGDDRRADVPGSISVTSRQPFE